MFEVEIFLNDLDPKAVRVKLYDDGINGAAGDEARVRQPTGASGGFIYKVALLAIRLPANYTARGIPHYDGVVIPLENTRILWQR